MLKLRENGDVKMKLDYRKTWDMRTGLLMAAVGAMLSLAFRVLFYWMGIDGYQNVEQQLTADKTLGILAVELVVLSPIIEEVLFRECLYRLLRKRGSAVSSALLSSVAFGIYHWNIPQGIYAFVMGLFLAWSLEQYQTMKAPIVIHMAANMMALIISI